MTSILSKIVTKISAWWRERQRQHLFRQLRRELDASRKAKLFL